MAINSDPWNAQRLQLEKIKADMWRDKLDKQKDADFRKMIEEVWNKLMRDKDDVRWHPKILPLPPGFRDAYNEALREAEMQIQQGKWVVGL